MLEVGNEETLVHHQVLDARQIRKAGVGKMRNELMEKRIWEGPGHGTHVVWHVGWEVAVNNC